MSVSIQPARLEPPHSARDVSKTCPRHVRDVSAKCPRSVRDVSATLQAGAAESLSPLALRARAAECAHKAVAAQRESFVRWGMLGDREAELAHQLKT